MYSFSTYVLYIQYTYQVLKKNIPMKITKFHNSIIVINIQSIYGAQFAICIPILNVNLHRIVQVPVGGTPTQLPSKAQQLHHLRSNNASSKGRTGTGTNEAILIFQKSCRRKRSLWFNRRPGATWEDRASWGKNMLENIGFQKGFEHVATK